MPELKPEEIRLLTQVQNAGQYVGGEINSVVKPECAHRLALTFPDTYAIGMSNHGMQVLYEAVNALPDWAAERAYVPEPEYEKLLREAGLPLVTLETRTRLADCAAVSVSMQYELGATGLLTMLDLGGIPLTRFEREGRCPLVIGGGHALFNPEPFSDFFDLIVIGEGEEALPEILTRIGEGRERLSRTELIAKIAGEVEGVYAPALYEVEDREGWQLVRARLGGAAAGATYPVKRRVLESFATYPLPQKPVVPVVESVHERAVLELMRGCPNGCRFCQAGMACRPVRERPVPAVLAGAEGCYRNTGYDEIGLLSLSTSDYSGFDELLEKLDAHFTPMGVNVSLPSLRVDHALHAIPKRLTSVRKSGLTIAPEAGSDRLRAAINKDVTNEDLLNSVEEAFRQGWKAVKLYFMIGLPTETDEDVAAIAELANAAARMQARGKARGPAITASVSNFVPKPFTPFQWEAMDAVEELRRKQDIVARLIDRKKVSYKAHDPEVSFLEGTLSRADRRVGRVVLRAWRAGARLDAWSDFFRPALWRDAFAAEGLAPETFALPERSPGLSLPWSHIDSGLSEAFFLRERARSREGVRTGKCAAGSCAGCGVAGCGYVRNE